MSNNNYDLNSDFNIPEEKSLTTIFKEYTDLSNENIKTLLNFRRENNFPTLNIESENTDDIAFVYETIGLIKKYGYNEALKFLRDNKDNVEEKSIFNSSIFDINRRKLKSEIEKLRTTIKIKSEGIFTCPKCKSKNTSYQEVQTRAGDEAATIFVNCNECSYSFRR